MYNYVKDKILSRIYGHGMGWGALSDFLFKVEMCSVICN